MDGEHCRLRFDIAYDGSDFHGWAYQRGLRTVEGTLADALRLILRLDDSYGLTVAGRTDAGVHAVGQVAHMDIPVTSLEHRSIEGDPRRLVRRLGKLLPEDIQVRGVDVAPPGFDARFSALRRHYEYRVTTFPAGPVPLRRKDTASWRKPVSLPLLQAAADMLTGLHDFAAFCKYKPHATTIRRLERFEWEDISTPREPDMYVAHVSADAFCWSMVRSLVGACLVVAEGRRDVEFAAGLLAEHTRSSEVPVAPACGLTLVGVDYPADEELGARAEATRRRREAKDVEDVEER